MLHAALARAEAELVVPLPNLRASAERTAVRVAEARGAVHEFLDDVLDDRRDIAAEPIIAAFGSMARAEMAPGSDFDYLVILRRLERDPGVILTYRRAALHALEQLGLEAPGSSGLFGCAVSGTDFVNTIGLDGDTNLHLSRRVLLLEESIGLNALDHHRGLIEAVIERYLHQARSDQPGVPRFLLNDVVRYWRTIAVDYEAKRWDELTSEKWGLRYVKLLSSRKLVAAGTLVSVFWPAIVGEPATAPALHQQFDMPAAARLAQLALVLGDEGRAHLRTVLGLADRFNGWLTDAAWRSAVEPVADPASADPGTEMATAVDAARALQEALEALFFCDEPMSGADGLALGQLSRRYLSF